MSRQVVLRNAKIDFHEFDVYTDGGGGGGYSGGNGRGDGDFGGGGGSCNSGTNQSNTSGVNSGHGQVTINLL